MGGRICSIPWKNSWLEKGAQFVHGLESVLAQSIVEKNLLSDENVAEGQGLYYREDGTLVKKKIILEVDDFVRDTLERLESYSDFPELCCRNDDDVGKILRREFESFNDEKDESPLLKTIKEELFDWNVRFVAIDNACTYLDELSVKKWGDYQVNSFFNYKKFFHTCSIRFFFSNRLSMDQNVAFLKPTMDPS